MAPAAAAAGGLSAALPRFLPGGFGEAAAKKTGTVLRARTKMLWACVLPCQASVLQGVGALSHVCVCV